MRRLSFHDTTSRTPRVYTSRTPRIYATSRTPRGRRQLSASAVVLVLALAVVLITAGCATTSPNAAKNAAHGRLRVVAAENFWGSIAAQLGGDRVDVASIISNPSTDPHDYEPSPADLRRLAGAQVVIANGLGYDPWMSKALRTNHDANQLVVTVGDVVGAVDGDNPHRWYNPADVHAAIAAITGAYQHADPADAAHFGAQRRQFETAGLARYDELIRQIRTTYSGTPIGASESIVAMIAPALGLDLVTPPTFLRAISEGADPTSADLQTIDQQIKSHLIKVYVYNSQNATPDVQAQIDAVRAAGIPVTTITETLTPATATFQSWQVSELAALQAALAQAAQGAGQ